MKYHEKVLIPALFLVSVCLIGLIVVKEVL